MKLPIRLSKRKFLNMLLASAAGCFLPFGLATAFKKGTSTTEALVQQLANFFESKESARLIGVEYLNLYSSECNCELLVNRLFSDNRERQMEFLAGDRSRQRHLLIQQQREDFRLGRVAQVHGWVLSETEVCLCALAALQQARTT